MRRVLTSLVKTTLARMILTMALVNRISSSSTRVMRHTRWQYVWKKLTMRTQSFKTGMVITTSRWWGAGDDNSKQVPGTQPQPREQIVETFLSSTSSRVDVQYVDKECSSSVDRRLVVWFEIEGVNPSSLWKSLKLCMIPVDVLVPRFERNRQRRWGWRVQQRLAAKRWAQTTRLWKSEFGSLWKWHFRIVEQRVVPHTSSSERNGGSRSDHSPETELFLCQWRYNAKYQRSSGRPLEATVATRTRGVSMSTQITVATTVVRNEKVCEIIDDCEP